MNYTFHIDSDQLSAQIAERLDHDAIASAIDLGELVDNISICEVSDEMYERYDIAEIAGAIDLGNVAEALYPLIINDEESLSNRIEVLESKTEEDDRRINDLIDRVRLLEASVTVFIPMPEPDEKHDAVDPWAEDEVIDLTEFDLPEWSTDDDDEEECNTCGNTGRWETTLEDAPDVLVDLGACPVCVVTVQMSAPVWEILQRVVDLDGSQSESLVLGETIHVI